MNQKRWPKKETRENLFAKADSLSDKSFRLSSSRDLKLAEFNIGLCRNSSFAVKLSSINSDVSSNYFTPLDARGLFLHLVLKQKAKSKQGGKRVHFKR